MPEDCVGSSSYENEYEGVFLRSIDSDRHLSACKDAAEIIKYDENLENKLLQVQEEARRIGTASTLNKDQ